jgi:CMP-2-keto-3-deoxyoctulosonic acid synthetase
MVVNVQGDEPEIEPATSIGWCERLAEESGDCPMATLACPFPAVRTRAIRIV